MENTQTYFTKNEALEDIKEILESYNGYYCDLHNEVFNTDYYIIGFSSPFIEERLYLENFKNVFVVSFSALLSWSNIDQNNGLD